MEQKKITFKRSHLIFLLIFLASAIGVTLWQYRWSTARIRLAGQELHVLVARTLAQQYKGLGGRASLAPYDGMLFLFDEPQRYGFVMRGMKFSIDIVWLHNGTVVDIAPNLPIEPDATEAGLMKYYPRTIANLVLELPAGWTGAHGVKIGDRLEVVNE